MLVLIGLTPRQQQDAADDKAQNPTDAATKRDTTADKNETVTTMIRLQRQL